MRNKYFHGSCFPRYLHKRSASNPAIEIVALIFIRFYYAHCISLLTVKRYSQSTQIFFFNCCSWKTWASKKSWKTTIVSVSCKKFNFGNCFSFRTKTTIAGRKMLRLSKKDRKNYFFFLLYISENYWLWNRFFSLKLIDLSIFFVVCIFWSLLHLADIYINLRKIEIRNRTA